ncbi:uncharacterized protein METZ01_LOCUS425955, partial [marine metagenome]
ATGRSTKSWLFDGPTRIRSICERM